MARFATRCVAIVGDSLALPDATPDGNGFVFYVLEALQEQGVEVQNWSQAGQSATSLATERLDEIKSLCASVTIDGKELFVILEVGTEDRAPAERAELLPDSLDVVTKAVKEFARPILMQVVPDDIDRAIADQNGSGYIPAPECLIEQFYKTPTPRHPFVPKEDFHKNMARSVLAALAEEMQLPLCLPDERVVPPPGQTPTHREMRVRKKKDKNMFMSTTGKGVAATPGVETHFDGVWIHKSNPNQIEMVQGNMLVSEDGQKTPMTIVDANTFFIVQEGQQITATLRGGELRWEDGDIWCLKSDAAGVPTLELPPRRANKSKEAMDSRLLMICWDRAEMAVKRTGEERQKNELKSAREQVEIERQELEGLRRQLDSDRQKLSTLR